MRTKSHQATPLLAVWHIFFHPDFHRRPWNFTRSADPAFLQALAGFHRRWGVTPRPEDVRLIHFRVYAQGTRLRR